ncbi:hypothetical protein DYB35_008777 [Aphanomyces astaci]|uniref:Uncharacterized protein n=1 Tax=Aphanomyces astaci TaxID=112090 RepID=A0A418D1Z5_APHAT|nr:hypothetical protein DYB35_008777 [Aphanomyces astaci]
MYAQPTYIIMVDTYEIHGDTSKQRTIVAMQPHRNNMTLSSRVELKDDNKSPARRRNSMAFQDAWVVDKTMFDYVSQGGGCACCGITNAMMNWDKFQQCSDWGTHRPLPILSSPSVQWTRRTITFLLILTMVLLDTDDEHRELFSPWPTFIHEDVQTQRCIIRASMKQQLSSYASFRTTHGDSFKSWLAALPLSAKKRCAVSIDHVVQSFRSDRRLLRLVIVRSFADILRRKYLRDVVHNLDENQHQASVDNTNDDDAADNNSNLDGC